MARRGRPRSSTIAHLSMQWLLVRTITSTKSTTSTITRTSLSLTVPRLQQYQPHYHYQQQYQHQHHYHYQHQRLISSFCRHRLSFPASDRPYHPLFSRHCHCRYLRIMTSRYNVAVDVNTDILLCRDRINHSNHNDNDNNDNDNHNNHSAPSWLGAIDQGTSSTRFVLYRHDARIAASAQLEHEQIYPSDHPGWHEHDPLLIYQNVIQCLVAVADAVQAQQPSSPSPQPSSPQPLSLAAIGITNQRETTVAWNRRTGKPYYNAIVWDDVRTSHIVHHIQTTHDGTTGKDCLRDKTGLPCATYFAGTKVKWLLDHVPELQHDILQRPDEVCFGTIDTWLLYQLTGKQPEQPPNTNHHGRHTITYNTGGLFATDVSNASRWLFLNLATGQWDADLVQAVCAPHSVPLSVLPTIYPSSHVYGHVSSECSGLSDCFLFHGVPLAGVLGDQQAGTH